MRALLFTAVLLLAAVSAAAHDYRLGDIAIGHIWAAPPQEDGGLAIYGPLLNRGDTPVTLHSATSPAGAVRLRIAKDGETAWPDHVTLEPGRPLALAAWRVHLWIADPDRAYAEGDTIPLTLDFGAAGSLDIEAVVEPEGGH